MDYASSLLGLLPGGRRTPGLKELLSTVETYLPPEQVARIKEAAEFGASAHKGQKRLSGEPYIAHPVAAASTTPISTPSVDTTSVHKCLPSATSAGECSSRPRRAPRRRGGPRPR